jgi:putative ABC transport system substrate-binding protein
MRSARVLTKTGYVEGRNVRIEYRWADGQYQRLPALAADLVGRQVAVIAAFGGNAPAQAAKATTTTIPIVFVSGGDPVSGGLVASFNRPGANVTGVSWIATALVPKRLELLHQMAGDPAVIGALVNPGYLEHDLQLRELRRRVRQSVKRSTSCTLPRHMMSTPRSRRLCNNTLVR